MKENNFFKELIESHIKSNAKLYKKAYDIGFNDGFKKGSLETYDKVLEILKEKKEK